MPESILTVWFDYTCPHSYRELAQLESVADRQALKIDRRPFLTRPDAVEQSPRQQTPSIGADGRREPLYRPGESLGTEPASNRSLSTLLVHAATLYAKELGLDGAFFRAASQYYWNEGADLGSLYTIRKIAQAIGLEWKDLAVKLESGVYHDQVRAQHAEAVAAGITQVPTSWLNGVPHSGF
ncbi:MAG: hypothetical protein CL759_06440 [Chloroflexi bacterium]|nr:hypothetical protein [Chloroflexota bacterium]